MKNLREEFIVMGVEGLLFTLNQENRGLKCNKLHKIQTDANEHLCAFFRKCTSLMQLSTERFIKREKLKQSGMFQALLNLDT